MRLCRLFVALLLSCLACSAALAEERLAKPIHFAVAG